MDEAKPSTSTAVNDDFDSKLADISSFAKSVVDGNDIKNKEKLSTLLQKIMSDLQKSKTTVQPRAKKRKIKDNSILGMTLTEMSKFHEFQMQRKKGKYVITPKKQAKPTVYDVDLPDEIWLKIFRYLPTKIILGDVARVCKRFYNITNDPTLIKTLALRGVDKYDCDQILKVIKRSKCVTTLAITHCKDNETLVSTALQSSLMLKTLIVDGESFSMISRFSDKKLCQLSVECAKSISEFGQKLENLHVRLMIPSDAFQHIAKLENLKHLEINHHKTIIKPQEFVTLAENCKQLEVLHLSFGGSFDFHDFLQVNGGQQGGGPLGGPNPQNLIQNINAEAAEFKSAMKTFFEKRKDTLRKLAFSSLGVGMGNTGGYFEHIDFCQGLENFNSCGSYSMNKLEVESLSRIPKLKTVKFRTTSRHDFIPNFLQNQGNNNPPEINNSVLVQFLTNVNVEDLENLKLSHCDDLDLEAFECLANRSCPNLKQLDLTYCKKLKLNDEVLIKLQSNCPLLNEVRLMKVQDEDVSDKVFYEMLSKNNIKLQINREKQDSVDKYIKYNVPPSEQPKSYRERAKNQTRMKNYISKIKLSTASALGDHLDFMNMADMADNFDPFFI